MSLPYHPVAASVQLLCPLLGPCGEKVMVPSGEADAEGDGEGCLEVGRNCHG